MIKIKQKLQAFIISATMLMSAIAIPIVIPSQLATVQAASSLRGDINGNGEINTADLILYAKYCATRVTVQSLSQKNSDCNNDGRLDADDLLFLIKYMTGEITEFPGGNIVDSEPESTTTAISTMPTTTTAEIENPTLTVPTTTTRLETTTTTRRTNTTTSTTPTVTEPTPTVTEPTPTTTETTPTVTEPTTTVTEPTPTETTPTTTETTQPPQTDSRKITIEGTKFKVGGNDIWFSGANTPWDKWNDFGGNFNASFWDSHFADLHSAGVNSTRIWITCNGDVGITFAPDGTITGATDKHWQDLDKLFELAEKHEIYIMATLISFDHFKNNTQANWRSMITDAAKTDAYVNSYVIPFAKRYDDNDYLWSIDLCNEPDWIYEDQLCGKLPINDISRYIAKATKAIHENSDILVTVGMAVIKYNTDVPGKDEGNFVNDAKLIALGGSPKCAIDFWSTHYYEWEREWFGVPFTQTPQSFGLDPSKPALIGECPATGLTDMTLAQCYEKAYENGWQGIMPWTSNGVDSNGGFSQVSTASKAILEKLRQLIFPFDLITPLNNQIVKRLWFSKAFHIFNIMLFHTSYRTYRKGKLFYPK